MLCVRSVTFTLSRHDRVFSRHKQIPSPSGLRTPIFPQTVKSVNNEEDDEDHSGDTTPEITRPFHDEGDEELAKFLSDCDQTDSSINGGRPSTTKRSERAAAAGTTNEEDLAETPGEEGDFLGLSSVASRQNKSDVGEDGEEEENTVQEHEKKRVNPEGQDICL